MAVLFFQNKYFPKVKYGENFKQERSFHHKNGVAFENENIFAASGLNEGGNLHSFVVPSGRAMSLKEWVAKSFGDAEAIESADSLAGTFYKRMWRPIVCGGNINAGLSPESLNSSLVSLRILVKKLDDLFETVEPTPSNLSTYGYKIREIILLACMEIESSWSAVLKENGYPSAGRWTTNDYVKLSKPMFLDAYELSLQSYPHIPTFVPFAGWNPAKPTESLPWYDAYNKAKHDRESNLRFATVNHAINAVGAAVIMSCAQFGFGTRSPWDQRDSVIWNLFRVTTVGLKRYEREFYIPKLKYYPESGEPGPSGEWLGIDYPFATKAAGTCN